ncbi:hypothetical protein [Undibacterium sp. TS12]|uniref:hypothetical protein n=1 Tax=Undibacterium sp. TS12 TaxID=2908202 RepID=UPI001F4C765B|nr:hypothetical protein [Undibacterium sp. TS12]MCH8622712.1 hypothetical protein [Undibacterium sp. TS12]
MSQASTLNAIHAPNVASMWTSMRWLLKREFWEHKGMFLWAPLTVAGLMVALFTLPMVTGHVWMHGYQKERLGTLATEHLSYFVDGLAGNYLLVSFPLLALEFLLIFFYCQSTLCDERRDRSVLFWKSLPLSDWLVVTSKLWVASVMLPVFLLLLTCITSLLILTIACLILLVYNVNAFPDLLSNTRFYLSPLHIFAVLPVYILWALPSIAWLMLVSSWVRSKVFLWAVGAPLILVSMLEIINGFLGLKLDLSLFSVNMVGRILGGILPGSWLIFENMSLNSFHTKNLPGVDFGLVMSLSWHTLYSLQLWLGVAAAAVMLYATVQIRRRRAVI